MSRRRWQFGTKKHAPAAALYMLREYARAHRRKASLPFGVDRECARQLESIEHGKALGAVSALYRCGLLTKEQYERYFARLGRINYAKVSRLPFDLGRAA